MANTNKHGLGNGLSSLIPKEINSQLLNEMGAKIHKLSVSLLEPNKDQPRHRFDETALKELAESIKQHGVIQPIVVTPIENSRYRIIAGERRWRAAQIAGEKFIPAVVRSIKQLESLEVAIIENIQREDLSPMELAYAYERLHQQFNIAYQEIANKLGKHKTTVRNLASLVRLPKEAIEALNNKIITEGHARMILTLSEMPEHQMYLIKKCIDGWNVRQAERYVTSVKRAGIKDKSEAEARVHTETQETKVLGKKLGTPVHIRRMAHGGRLEIDFKSDDDLKRIIERIK